jgi:pimeloyl-ACP methyl ester carboxylesterase
MRMPDRWLLIRGGTVIDGAGRQPARADVLVRNNRIHAVSVSALPGQAPPPTSCPVLVVHGAEDLITRPDHNQRAAASIPRSRLVEIPKASPLAFLEQPAAMNAATGKFLQDA